ncbi:acetylserotonin O-methyltransferase-like isoform X2 [Tenrec ecaudatus]|uniref:acetylserotonin O-methyltransferase-like isoform X2 n=1 Tax=Tenrec ecaudatus TaxID=94439 RepID=UPI003F5A1472
MDPAADSAYELLSQYSHSFMVSQVLFAACELGLFDLLAEAGEPLSSAAVATGLGTSPHGTELLLDTCASLELLTVETGAGRALYRNSGLASSFLTRTSPTSQLHMLRYLSNTTYPCWAHLAAAVREGRPQYSRAFGVPSQDLFAAIYRSEAEQLCFMRGLQEVWAVHGRAVMTAFDLSSFPVICDLGGDFFKDPLPAADLYVLARVLHDWTDDRCSHLLARIHHTCKPGGGILVVESVLREDGRGPLTTQLYSLNMLVQTEGRERTPAEYCRLLSSAGFQDFRMKKTGCTYDAMLARK